MGCVFAGWGTYVSTSAHLAFHVVLPSLTSSGPQVGAEKELRTVIEGESLFNDGSAYVLFLLFHVSNLTVYAGFTVQHACTQLMSRSIHIIDCILDIGVGTQSSMQQKTA